MKMIISHNWDHVSKIFEVLPGGLEIEVYGRGLLSQARWAAAQSRQLLAANKSISKGIPTTVKGEPRRHLIDSIVTRRIGWHFFGKYIPKSAALVIAEQPHAHLVELGTVKTNAKPFLAPPVRNKAGLLEAYKRGSIKYYRSLFKRYDKGKLNAREKQLFRM